MTSTSRDTRRFLTPAFLALLIALSPLAAQAQQNITGMMEDVDITGPAYIDPAAGVDGGKLSGLITNEGIVKGEIELGPVTFIDGGRVAGDIRGTANSPALIEAKILAGTRLENVVILAGSEIEEPIELGYNVRFETQESIPAGIDLAQTLGFTPWRSGDRREVPRLDHSMRARLNGPALPTIVDDIAALPEFANMQVSQNGNGELIFTSVGPRSIMLPVEVRQARADDVRGVSVLSDGGMRFTTDWQVVTAYPIAWNALQLSNALAKQDLSFRYGATPELAIRPSHTSATHSFAARASTTVLPGRADLPLDLTQTPEPGLANVARLSLLFIDASTQQPLTQDFSPWPADWPALRSHLLDTAGADVAEIADDGSITVELGDATIRVLPAYAITAGTSPGAQLLLHQAGDMNGDGLPDFRVTYANGSSQILYRYP